MSWRKHPVSGAPSEWRALCGITRGRNPRIQRMANRRLSQPGIEHVWYCVKGFWLVGWLVGWLGGWLVGFALYNFFYSFIHSCIHSFIAKPRVAST